MVRTILPLDSDRWTNPGVAAAGLALVIGSLAIGSWFVLSGDAITGLAVLLYVVVGVTLAALGIASESDFGANGHAR
ncbi:MAG: hypothetical protein ABEI57_03350 [Halapricum sp.]